VSCDVDGPVILPRSAPLDPRDLEGIVSVLEIAAIYLTEDPESTFTEAELLAKAHEISGADFPFQDVDARIVLRHASFLSRSGERMSLR